MSIQKKGRKIQTHIDRRQSSRRVLALDIETSPILSYNWGLFEQTAIKKVKPTTILSVAYQWYGEKTQVIACDTLSELSLLKKLHKLLDEADVVIAHNGDSFDIKKINYRFIVYRMAPPSPYKTVDTKKVAKSVACFDSNSLNNLGIDMEEGEKIKHRGFDMWEGCMAGNRKDWSDMKRYNKRDVDLLVKVYERLRPWAKNHPDMREFNGTCTFCKSSKLQSRGTRMNKLRIYQRFQCMDCGGWSTGSLKKDGR